MKMTNLPFLGINSIKSLGYILPEFLWFFFLYRKIYVSPLEYVKVKLLSWNLLFSILQHLRSLEFFETLFFFKEQPEIFWSVGKFHVVMMLSIPFPKSIKNLSQTIWSSDSLHTQLSIFCGQKQMTRKKKEKRKKTPTHQQCLLLFCFPKLTLMLSTPFQDQRRHICIYKEGRGFKKKKKSLKKN